MKSILKDITLKNMILKKVKREFLGLQVSFLNAWG